MQRRASVLVIALMISLISASAFALTPYSQDFEGLVQSDTGALTNDGWLIFGNVFDSGGGYLYGYGVFGAPNDGGGFCQIALGEGGAAQGDNVLVAFSDYNNTDHGVGNLIESNVFQEQTVGAGDVGETWVFTFDAKLGNLDGASTAAAFIKTLDPNAGWAMTNFITVETTAISDSWNTYSVSIVVDASLEGQILQIGFTNTATNYESSGVFYDNINFNIDGTVATEGMSWGNVKSMYR